ncbi:AraC-like DNA-binding protein [Lactobacillus colini]|uniref:AraC-like DNA-binding protein n=1 Tax=Lactobacillus colini TaxID=1819254 RepID=A0ABS4MG23_9LACO|nr:AraC family transcriptional regulator [Lactobacillus colini]MBP2058642.1 AraC-like DNA-binding protein [Lactobacillus colini]
MTRNSHEIVKTTDPLPIWLHIFENSTTQEYIAPHWHRGIELSFTQYGQIDDFVIGKCHYTTDSGQLLVVNSQEIHSIATQSRLGERAISIIFPYEYVYKYYPDIEHELIEINEYDKLNSKQRLAYAKMQGLLTQIITIYETDSKLKNLALVQLVDQVLFLLLEYFSIKQQDSHRTSPKKVYIINRLQFITQYVNSNYQERISLDDIAQKCNISKEYLARFFKQEMGITVETYINNVRAQNARQDLLGQVGNLTTIALHNGFSGIRTMNRAFNNLYGITASDFKRKLNKTNLDK